MQNKTQAGDTQSHSGRHPISYQIHCHNFEKLYDPGTISVINIWEYVEEFTKVIQSAYHSVSQDIIIQKDLGSFSVKIIQEDHLDCIYDELLNNAFDMVFPERIAGR